MTAKRIARILFAVTLAIAIAVLAEQARACGMWPAHTPTGALKDDPRFAMLALSIFFFLL